MALNAVGGLRLVCLLSLILLQTSCDDKGGSPGGSQDNYDYPEGKIFFQSLPIDMNGVIFYESIGALDIFPKDHGGFHHKEIQSPNVTIPVFAMADGQITSLGKGGVDYFVSVRYSTTISVRLGHVGSFSSLVLDHLSSPEPGAFEEVTIPVKSGDIIGYVCSCSALDLGLHDESLELNFSYPEEYGFELRYAADPLNYYEDPLRTEFLNKVLREDEPRGGKVDYDVRGKIIGNWHLEIDPHVQFGDQLAIAYDHIHGSRISISDGYARFVENISENIFWIKGNIPKPEDIGVGVQVKYEMIVPDRWKKISDQVFELSDISNVDMESPVVATYLLELVGTERLKVESFVGKTADEVSDFTGNERVYVRRSKP